MSEQTKWVLLSLKINLLQSDKKKFEDVRLLLCISKGEKKSYMQKFNVRAENPIAELISG